MLEGETILCISLSSWFSLWRSRQQIMSRLCKKNRVIFIEPQKSLSISFFKDIKKWLKPLFGIHHVEIQKNLEICYPPFSLPLFGHIFNKKMLKVTTPFIVKINRLILKRYIKKVQKYLKFEKPLLWIYHPFHFKLLGAFNEKLTIFYVIDEISLYARNDRISDILEEYDALLCKKADIVFACSNALHIKRKPLNNNTYLIENAADFTHFNKAQDASLKMPEDIKDIRHPIIGFSGCLAWHIDIDLLIEIARTHPEWSLVLVGPDELPKSDSYYHIKSMNNVFFLGEKNIRLLPNYLKSFDVAIMPYDIKTHAIAASTPLKTFEYLAAGKPVVCVKLPLMNELKEIVKFADTPQEFIFHIEGFLKRKSDEVIKQGIEEARKNTWDNRVAKICEHISNALQEQSTA